MPKTKLGAILSNIFGGAETITALGNAVHKDVARLIAKKLINYGKRSKDNLIQISKDKELLGLTA